MCGVVLFSSWFSTNSTKEKDIRTQNLPFLYNLYSSSCITTNCYSVLICFDGRIHQYLCSFRFDMLRVFFSCLIFPFFS